jgi:hypothetical protein
MRVPACKCESETTAGEQVSQVRDSINQQRTKTGPDMPPTFRSKNGACSTALFLQLRPNRKLGSNKKQTIPSHCIIHHTKKQKWELVPASTWHISGNGMNSPPETPFLIPSPSFPARQRYTKYEEFFLSSRLLQAICNPHAASNLAILIFNSQRIAVPACWIYVSV